MRGHICSPFPAMLDTRRRERQLCRAKVAEVDAKQAQRMAEAINRAADRAEAQLNSQARKDKAASKQRQQEHEAAKAEQQRQKKVSLCHVRFLLASQPDLLRPARICLQVL